MRGPVEGERIGRFLVVDVIGRGAMGVVVRAFDPRLQRLVAIKLVNPERSERAGLGRERLLSEARALARLSHPNVVAVFEVDVHEQRDYVAMELIDGIDLQRWLRERPRHWREITRVFAAAAEGLHAVHLAGLVHRDVKPANILMGRDGQVRVGDFGIARRIDTREDFDADATISGGADVEHWPLTEAGRVMGTPVYMAPEQHAGAPVGPAADQYALCVSLFEALWGRPPFGGPPARLAAAKRHPPRAPPHRGIPGWLFRVVVRGLEPDPQRRHGSARELAAALGRDPAARRRGIALVAAAITGTVLAVAMLRGDPPCAGGQARLAEAWSADVRASIGRAFASSTRPYAPAVWSQVSARIDDYAARWVALHTEACEATRVRGDPSGALLDRRMSCLARRRDHLVATLDLLARGGDEPVDAAFTLVGRLPALAPCAEAGSEAAVALPDDLAVRARVEAARAEVARARATYDAGRYDEALALADRTAAEARELAYEPLLVEALLVRGDALQTRGRHDEARVDLREATWTAIAIGHDTVAVEAAASLVWLESEYVRDFAAAAQWVEVARSELRRSGSPPAMAARVGNVIGVSMVNVGRWDEALAEYEHALGLIVDNPAEAYTAHGLRVNMANVYVGRGEGGRAREIYERELEGLEAMLGHDHPKVNALRNLLSDALSESGELDRAIVLGEATLASMHRVYGERGSELARAAMGLAISYVRAERRDEGLVLYRRARDLFSASGDRTGLALALANLGSLEIERGAYDAAEIALDRALALQHEIYGRESSDMVYPMIGKVDVLQAQGRLDEAEAMADQAERIATATLGPLAHERIVAKQVQQGVLARKGRLDEAIAVARDVLELAEQSDDVRSTTRPVARGELASLLVDAGAPAEALVLLDEAIADPGTRGSAHAVGFMITRGAALRGMGRDADARAELRRAVGEADRRGMTDASRRAKALLEDVEP